MHKKLYKKLYKKKQKKYVIVSPHHYGGGPIVLHQLCKTLSELGYSAKIFYCDCCPTKKENIFKSWLYWLYGQMKYAVRYTIAHVFQFAKFTKTRKWQVCLYIPVRGCKRKWLPFFDKNTVVVYPQHIYGNFLKAKKVVRWLLYYYSFDTYDAFGENDLIFAFRDVFNDIKLNPTGRMLKISAFDFELYRQTNFGKRSGNCYIIRKGIDRKDLPQKFDGVIVDNLSEPEIVKVFNKCKYCYSYDTQTAYSVIAAICGCISIVVTEEGKSRDDYLNEDDRGWGVAYGESDEELKFAESTRFKCIDEFKTLIAGNRENAEYFVRECEKFFI